MQNACIFNRVQNNVYGVAGIVIDATRLMFENSILLSPRRKHLQWKMKRTQKKRKKRPFLQRMNSCVQIFVQFHDLKQYLDFISGNASNLISNADSLMNKQKFSFIQIFMMTQCADKSC